MGRGAECAELERALGSVERPLDLVLRGEAGIGKTTVWQHVRRRLTDGKRTVLATRPSESEASLPYAALVDLFGGVVDAAALDRLPEPQRVAVEVALLRRRTDGEGISELAVSAGVLRIVDELVRKTSLVLAIDDAQWVDAASARTLAFVLRRLGGSDVTVLSTVRSPHRSTVGHGHGGRTVEVVLRGLDLDGLDGLVEVQLGRRLLLPGLIQLARLSGGNPMVALEVVRASDALGVDLDLGTAVAVPPELRQLLRRRLDVLSEATRWLLVLSAAAAVPDLEVLSAAAPDLDMETSLREAERAQVIDLTDEAPRFVHPLLAEVITAAATPTERRAAHACLSRAVDDAVDRARHLAAATSGPDEATASLVERGAHEAMLRAAPASAAPLFERAVALTAAEDAERFARRTVGAVEAWNDAGAPRRGVDVARRSIAVLPCSPWRGRVMAVLSTSLSLRGGDEPAIPVLERAAGEVRGDDAATAVVLRQLGWARAVAGDLRRALEAALEALSAAERIDDPPELAATLAAVAMLQFLGGEPEARESLRRATEVLPTTGTSAGHWDLERDRTVMAAWADDPDAPSLIAVQRRSALDRGQAETVQYWEWYQVLVQLRTGPWTDLLPRVAAIGRDARRLGIGGQTASGLWLSALVEAHHGCVDDARRHAEAGIQAARDEQMHVFELWCEGALGFLEVGLGEHERAAERLWELHRRCEEAGFGEPGHLRHMADAVEALLASGRVARADAVTARLQELGSRTGHRWAQAAGLRCRGMVREADGDRGHAIVDLQGAVELHEQLGQPFELARTLLVLGAALRRAKQKGAARQALERAATIFEGLPAPLWRDRASDELSRVGVSSGSRWELTPTERRIAGLVASGRTNREVAAALSLSTKTVEWNLSKVYRKVGVRSRSELASSWDRGPGTSRSGGSPGSTEGRLP